MQHAIKFPHTAYLEHVCRQNVLILSFFHTTGINLDSVQLRMLWLYLGVSGKCRNSIFLAFNPRGK